MTLIDTCVKQNVKQLARLLVRLEYSLRRYAEKHHPAAQFALGCHLREHGMWTEAVLWIGKAAQSGHRQATTQFNELYLQSNAGIAELQCLSEAGHPDARFDLSCLYFVGANVPRNEKKAVVLLCSAAEQGHLKSQQRLAFLYEVGDGVPKDLEQAKYWRERAEAQGKTGPESA